MALRFRPRHRPNAISPSFAASHFPAACFLGLFVALATGGALTIGGCGGGGGGGSKSSGATPTPSPAATPTPMPVPTPTPTPTPVPTPSITPTAVTISPASVTLNVGDAAHFSATVTGVSNTAVSWSIAESGGGGINVNGDYTTPSARGTYHIVATSQSDGLTTGTATVVIQSGSATGTIKSAVPGRVNVGAGKHEAAQ